jgi:hypothetical protein
MQFHIIPQRTSTEGAELGCQGLPHLDRFHHQINIETETNGISVICSAIPVKLMQYLGSSAAIELYRFFTVE